MEKITEDMEGLEMHSAVRNVMRLFDRIKDFEKRVLARQPALVASRPEALIAALSLLAQLLGPFAPAHGRGAAGSRSDNDESAGSQRLGQAYRCRR